MISDSYGIYCNVDGEKHYYEASTTRDKPDVIDLHSTDEKILKEMNIDTSKYKSKKKLINDVKKYVISHGGTCN